MRALFLFVALVAVVSGLMLIIAPTLLVKASAVLNRIIATDELVLTRRRLFGVILVGSGAYMVYFFTQIP